VSKNVDTIKATAGSRTKVQYDIEVKVTNEDNLRHPYLLVDYGDDVQVDKASIELENWEMTTCPGENSQCSTDNQSRKCLRKNIGATLSKDVKLIKEKLFLTLLATGEKDSIDVNVQMYSCSACNKVVLSCDGKKCKKFTSSVKVTADELVREKDVKLRMMKDKIEYSSDTNEVLSSSVDIEYTVKITGQTPVKKGDFQVNFNFPGFKASDWLQNPCLANSISVTPNILETSCPRFSEGNDGFTIEAISTETINSATLGSRDIRIAVQLRGKEDTCPQGNLTLTMTTTTMVNHELYDEKMELNSEQKPFELDGKSCIAQAGIGPGLWALVGLTGAFILFGIVFICKRSNQTKVQKHKGQLNEPPSRGNEQHINYTEGTLPK